MVEPGFEMSPQMDSTNSRSAAEARNSSPTSDLVRRWAALLHNHHIDEGSETRESGFYMIRMWPKPLLVG